MHTITRILIVALFALSLFWGLAQEVIIKPAFQPESAHYPYWWDRAEPGLHQTWARLESMGVWDEYR
jgi:hypothetical protein